MNQIFKKILINVALTLLLVGIFFLVAGFAHLLLFFLNKLSAKSMIVLIFAAIAIGFILAGKEKL